jgi:hypothetical protein
MIAAIEGEAGERRYSMTTMPLPLLAGEIQVTQDRQRDNLVAGLQHDAAHAHRRAAGEYLHLAHGEADALAGRRRQQYVVLFKNF